MYTASTVRVTPVGPYVSMKDRLLPSDWMVKELKVPLLLLPDTPAGSIPWMTARDDPAGVEEPTWQADLSAVDLLKAGSISLIIYTGTTGAHAFADEKAIRRNAVTYRVPCITTISGARAAVEAIASKGRDPIRVWSLQEIHGTTTAAAKR